MSAKSYIRLNKDGSWTYTKKFEGPGYSINFTETVFDNDETFDKVKVNKIKGKDVYDDYLKCSNKSKIIKEAVKMENAKKPTSDDISEEGARRHTDEEYEELLDSLEDILHDDENFERIIDFLMELKDKKKD